MFHQQDSTTDLDSIFDFIEDWPDEDPDASLLMEATTRNEDTERILEDQPHVAHIYKSKDTYASFVSTCMMPCVGKDVHRSYVTGAKTLEECFTVEDEAMCLLVLVNSYRKWQDEAKWRLESNGDKRVTKVPEDIMRIFSKTLYTETLKDDEGKRVTRHGWSGEGQAVFLLLKRAVALKRRTFPDIEEYRTYVSDKMCRKSKRKAQRDLTVEEPKRNQYLAFISMAEDMNGCIV